MTLGDLEQLTLRSLSSFRLSTTRSNHLASLRAIFGWLEDVRICGEMWIDGSFMTEKIDPSDIDLILRIRSDEYEPYNKRTALERLVSDDIYARMKCDLYLLLEYPTSDFGAFEISSARRTLFLDTFGRQVNDKSPKGIAVIQLPSGKPESWN